jgi:hypothetical protein
LLGLNYAYERLVNVIAQEARRKRTLRLVRRCVEYAVAAGLALLSGYFILQVRW